MVPNEASTSELNSYAPALGTHDPLPGAASTQPTRGADGAIRL